MEKKFYFKATTDHGDVTLVIKEKDLKLAEEKLYKKYIVNSIIQRSDHPIKEEIGLFMQSPILGLREGSRRGTSSKRYSHMNSD